MKLTPHEERAAAIATQPPCDGDVLTIKSNDTAWRTSDIKKLCESVLDHMAVSRRRTVTIKKRHGRGRLGDANIRGRSMRLYLDAPAPGQTSMGPRELSGLADTIQHEALHNVGLQHGEGGLGRTCGIERMSNATNIARAANLPAVRVDERSRVSADRDASVPIKRQLRHAAGWLKYWSTPSPSHTSDPAVCAANVSRYQADVDALRARLVAISPKARPTADLVAKRAERAEASLARWIKAERSAASRVKKWKATVRYYEKKLAARQAPEASK